MTETLYRVILYSSLSDRRLIDTVRQRVAAASDISSDCLDKLFSGQPIILYESVNLDTALRYKSVINGAGAVCEIEPLNKTRTADDIGFIERRRNKRRETLRKDDWFPFDIERRDDDRRAN